MHRRSTFALSLAFALGAAVLVGPACSGGSGPKAESAGSASFVSPPEASVGKALAKVNGAPVGTLAFDALAQRKSPADGKAYTAEEKREVLEQAITDELLFQEAMRRGLFYDPKVRRILANALLKTDVFDAVKTEDFTPDQVRAYYEAHKEEFVVPAKTQVKRLLLAITPERDQAATEKLARDLIAKIKADPEAFTEIANEFSTDPFARRGGDLGYLSEEGKAGVPPEIVTRALGMGVGEISEPFLFDGGVNVVFVPNKRERLERTFEQMENSVLRKMKNEKYEALTKALSDKLRSTGKIEVDQAALDAYVPAPPQRGPMGLPGAEGMDGVTPAPMPAPNAPASAGGDEEPSDVELRQRQMEDRPAATPPRPAPTP
jgi:parvulin-like peptidyl-prolyl isomerase